MLLHTAQLRIGLPYVSFTRTFIKSVDPSPTPRPIAENYELYQILTIVTYWSALKFEVAPLS